MLYWSLSFTLPTRPARQAVLQTHSKSLGFTKLPPRQQFACVSPLPATLMDPLASVANKRLTAGLTPLDATLTKNRGVGGGLPVRLALSAVREGSAGRPFVTSLLPYLLTSSFLLTRSHSS